MKAGTFPNYSALLRSTKRHQWNKTLTNFFFQKNILLYLFLIIFLLIIKFDFYNKGDGLGLITEYLIADQGDMKWWEIDSIIEAQVLEENGELLVCVS